MKTQYTLQQAVKGALIISVALAAVPLFSGCSSHRHAAVTTTETRVENPDGSVRYRMSEAPTEVETKTTKTESSGGGLFSIIGDIIALPFRALAAIF